MKKLSVIIFLSAFTLTSQLYAQTMKPYKAGHVFNISLPDYMIKTGGLNSASAIQYKNVVKDVYGFVIFDTKEELRLVEMNYGSVTEFYDDFIKDFLSDQQNRKVGNPVSSSKGGVNFVVTDVTYYDTDAKGEIYYLVGIVETKNSFYKVLTWTGAESKDKFKADFEKIVYSVND